MMDKKILWGVLLGSMLSVTSCIGKQAGEVLSVRMPVEFQTEKEKNVSDNREADIAADWQEPYPKYSGEAAMIVNHNQPLFTPEEITARAFENYSELDDLGRCGVAFANICQEIMPKGERGNIGDIRPSGWHTVKYDIITDRYLYNRCHLIGYQLAGENDNERNLITGTRYLNIEGMLPWENQVAEYVKKTGNHVIYRVTPCYEGNNLLASGVRIEAFSVEDEGEGICFHIYCYNVQPGILIDYATGESRKDEAWAEPESGRAEPEYHYVLNTNTRRFHSPDCASVQKIHEKNKEYFAGETETLKEKGYIPCGRCKPQ